LNLIQVTQYKFEMLRNIIYCTLCPFLFADDHFEQSQYNGGGDGGFSAGQYNGDGDGGFGGGAQYIGGAGTGGKSSFGGSGFSSSFGGSNQQGSYQGGQGNQGSLEETIPGIPGEDYPIFSDVPETSFSCVGQVDGGYYGDPEAECQAFHICASDGNGGLSRYSFLCPNGTLFQQQYFICDWWFNVDCSTTEDFYSLNDEIAAEREANSPFGGQGQYGNGQGGQKRGGSGGKASASSPRGSYAAPPASSPRGSYAAPSSSSSRGSYTAPSGSYSSPNNGGFGGASSGYGAPGGLGPYARNPRGVELSSVLNPPPLPEGFVLEQKESVEDME